MAQILLLEDDPELRLVFKEYLLRDDHSVHSVGACDEALVALKRNTLDVLILDVMIAKDTSLNIASAATTLAPMAKVIFVTGSSEFCMDEAYKVNGHARSILRKPVSMIDLQSAVAHAMQERTI